MSETKASPKAEAKAEAKPEPVKPPTPEAKKDAPSVPSFSPDDFKEARAAFVPTSIEAVKTWQKMVDAARLNGYEFRGGESGKVSECALVKDGKTIVDALVPEAPAKDGKKS